MLVRTNSAMSFTRPEIGFKSFSPVQRKRGKEEMMQRKRKKKTLIKLKSFLKLIIIAGKLSGLNFVRIKVLISKLYTYFGIYPNKR